MSDHSDDGPSEGDDNQIVHMEEGDGNDEDDDVMDLAPDEDEQPVVEETGEPKVWDPSVYKLEEDEELDYDPTAYKCMHELGVEWPCLSFDIVPDSLGFMRKNWPQTMYMVGGTQASDPQENRINVMKISNISEMKPEDDNDEFDEDDDEDYVPVVHACQIKQKSAINRVKCMPQNGAFVSAWAEDGSVIIHNVAPLLRMLDEEQNENFVRNMDWKPVAQFTAHRSEGFACNWSPLEEGTLLSGDSTGAIHLWRPEVVGGGNHRNWAVDTVPFLGHEGSVEDLCWSPVEARVFASCSSDRTVRLWDARGKKQPVLTVATHADEVNVISWNSQVHHLIAAGGDDGVWKVHDLRFAGGAPQACDVFTFGFHKSPITSIEWCPFEDSMVALSSADDSVSVWDLSATHDDDEPAPDLTGDAFLASVPEQLLFLHRGVFDPKEVHWHRQIPGMIVATAANGYHLFAPENVVP